MIKYLIFLIVFLCNFAYAGVQEDIATLKAGMSKPYKQAIGTPEQIPLVGTDTKTTSLSNPVGDLSAVKAFVPTAKDYQYRIDVWTRLHKDDLTTGYRVTAKRFLDAKKTIIEIITSTGGDPSEI